MSHLDVLFQRNTIFTMICLVLGYGFVWLLPRMMPRSISLLMMLFSIESATALDTVIGVKPFDFYNANIYPYFDLADLLTWSLYPVFGYLFAYYYNKFRIKGLLIPLYILVSSLIGTAFEALNVYFDVFQYNHWKLSYSFCIYLVVQTLTVLLFTRLKKHWIEQKSQSIRRMY
ncbi:hypothetical protein [Paenibacillus qinlingensis]|uniref:Uncharacterized protein n=1 Tax=Paenibacillus qinlingensis TaxID=1837343 RepID=A0ABU1NQW4_9BACL|nr:hypothetical protein [Paenibacillus qinlingensis]MDR6549873.1 hypothetical protein [Paenibacillus qinlingensis]